MSWETSSSYIATGSVDNSVIIWDVSEGKSVQVLKDGNNYVIAVSWDPTGEYLVALSLDKVLFVYKNVGIDSIQFFLVASVRGGKRKIGDSLSYASFFRENMLDKSTFSRCAWSPDGNIFLCTGGSCSERNENIIWGFVRSQLERPRFCYSTLNEVCSSIMFCPIPFKSTKRTFLDCPYYFVFACAVYNSVIIYSTDCPEPLFVLANIHLKSIDDMAWQDARKLAIASSDGYVSFVIFDENELGEPVDFVELPAWLAEGMEKRKKIEMKQT